jgi:two-component system sensor histidine kinase AdeS
VARLLNRIATRMWLLAGLMTTVTLAVGIGCFYLATYFELYRAREYMPPGIRAELDHLIATGQRGSDRYYELFDRYTGDDLRSNDLPFLGIIALISTLTGGSIAFVFARRISRPITAVTEAAALVASGDRSVRVDGEGASGEMGELVDSFNHMAADIEAYERERTVLTAGIAHELRTPLTILKGRLHGLLDGVIDPNEGEAERLLRQVEQLSRLVEDLRTLAHADAGELELDLRLIDLGDVLHAAVADLMPSASAAQVRLVEKYEPARVRADPVRITQIVTNLLTNAIKHAPGGSAVHVEVRIDGDQALASVADEGAGFRPEDRHRLFIPFWRAGANKALGRPGSGLGLALAAKLAEAHRGRIVAENRADRSGAVFTLCLPAVGSRGAGTDHGDHQRQQRRRQRDA